MPDANGTGIRFNPNILREGIVIKGPFWKEPIKINKVEYISGGEFISIVGSTLYSKEHVDAILERDQIEALEIIG
ncbi:MAG: hypothetical protein Q9N34_06740 [Aquificota bacterium]|nr:hypothetical protein [Aquificota bacterium]